MRKALFTMMCLLAMMAAGTGLKAQEITITLAPGWNWISYSNAVPMEISEALGDFVPMNGDRITSQFSSSSYVNGHWRGSITQLMPGWGYMYYSVRTEDVEFTFSQSSSNVVTTSTPTDITATSAVVGGTVTLPEGTHVFLRGVCWGTEPSPDIDGNHTTEGTGIGSFSSMLEDLEQGTTYYVRAYAVSDYGLAYGNEVSFATEPLPSYTVTVSSNPTEGGTAIGGGTYEQGQSCTVTATANAGYTFTNWTENGTVVSTNATYTFTVNADRSLVANFIVSGGGNHAYVDLGLPSGLLWATCNVGANNPEDYGDYFAWGETTTKDTYNWSTYQYCNGSSSTLTKYCNNSSYGYNGFTDNLTTLLPEDDAATANWGSDWRMPTKEEWQELYQNTTHTWTTQNGVNGRLFTASNGNSLFLPAAGYRYYSNLSTAGSHGYYWSSSLFTEDCPYIAWRFDFTSGFYNVGYDSRNYGRSVRPVRSSGQNYTVTVSSNPAEGGTATGGGTYEQGQSCTVTATANAGYTFTNWTENGTVVSTNATYTFTVNADRSLVANFIVSSGGDHACVDLGLPSGLLWATCNVGADNPEDYGDYFAWGETQPKDTYNSTSYQYSEDDAATANWGNGWRMPTKEEWEELYNNTTSTWTTQNGVNGRLFTANNGNSIFLPAAGYRQNSGLVYAGSYAGYWSSSLYTDDLDHAWVFRFTSGYYNMAHGNRYLGLSVRPVRVGSQSTSFIHY